MLRKRPICKGSASADQNGRKGVARRGPNALKTRDFETTSDDRPEEPFWLENHNNLGSPESCKYPSATIIAHVGCLEGFRVRGGPDSVGRSTTSAVVKSTSLVIVADAVFTAIFYFTVKP